MEGRNLQKTWCHSFYIRANYTIIKDLECVFVCRFLTYWKCAFWSSCACAKYHSGLCSLFIHSVVSNNCVSTQWRLWSDCADARADLGLRCPHMSEETFSHGEIITIMLIDTLLGFSKNKNMLNQRFCRLKLCFPFNVQLVNITESIFARFELMCICLASCSSVRWKFCKPKT